MMFKKVLIGGIGLAVVAGLGLGAYGIARASSSTAQKTDYSFEVAQGQGPGRGQGEGNGDWQGRGQGSGRGEDCDCDAAQGNRQGGVKGRGMGSGQEYRPGSGREGAQGQGYGQDGDQGQGSGQGMNRRDFARNGSGMPQANVDDWMTLSGEIGSVEATSLTLVTGDGQTVEVALGPEHFWSEQGVTLATGQQITIQAFEEDGEIKVGQILLTDTGTILQLRDESGRPMWAGQGAGQNRR